MGARIHHVFVEVLGGFPCVIHHLAARLVQFPNPVPPGRDLLGALGAQRIGDPDVLRFTGPLLHGRDLQNAVQIEAHAAENLVGIFHRCQAFDTEIPNQDVLQRVFVVALIYVNIHRGLIGVAGRVHLGARQRQRRIAPDDGMVTVRIGNSAAVAEIGDAEGERRNVHQHAFHGAPGEPRCHHPGAQRHGQIRMHVLARLQAGLFDEQVGDQRCARRAAHQQNRIHVAGLLAGILQRFGHAVERGFHQRTNHGLIFFARNFHFEMQGPEELGDQRLLADLDIRFKAQFLLGFFRRPPEPRLGRRVPLADIDAVLLFELGRQALGQQIVEVVAAEVVVAVTRQHLGDVAFHGDHGDIEGAAAEVVNERRVPRSVAVAVGQAGRRGLIENAHHFQSGERAGLARGVALRIGKVGGHGDHGLLGALAQRAVGPLREFTQDERGDLLRQKVLAAHAHFFLAAHPALDAAHGALGVKRLLVARRLAHQQFSGRGESHAGGQHAGISRPQHPHLAAGEGGDLRIGGP